MEEGALVATPAQVDVWVRLDVGKQEHPPAPPARSASGSLLEYAYSVVYERAAPKDFMIS